MGNKLSKYFFRIGKLFLALGAICLHTSCSNNSHSSDDDQAKETTAISKDSVLNAYSKYDLHKLKWIEGKWKGIDGQNPFYEIYQLTNDSTLMITSYEWNGKDSSKSSVDFVTWFVDGYFLGKDKNWRVTSITDNEVKMLPVKASNDITWRFKDSSNWEAILTSKQGSKQYLMQHFDPFKK